MDVFIAIATVVGVALLLATKPTYRLRRSRPMVVLIAGGWITLALGVLLGPHVLDAIKTGPLQATTPLLFAGLGWIGFMVGLQLRADVIRALPVPAKALATADAAITVPVFGGIALAGLALWTSAPLAQLALPAALIACAAVGCAMETRSLRVTGQSPGGNHLALVIRALGGLGAIAAIALFGVAEVALPNDQTESAIHAATRLAATAGAALAIATLARFALNIAGNTTADQLAVVLGVVALAAGAAVKLGVSPLVISMLAGVILANMTGNPLRRFQKFLVSAEHITASMVMLLAGVMLDPRLAPIAVGLAAALALARIIIKPTVTRLTLARAGKAVEKLIQTTPATSKSPLYAGPARQSPIAIPLALAYALEQPSDFSRQILALIVLTGLLAESLPLILAMRTKSIKAKAEAHSQANPQPTTDNEPHRAHHEGPRP